MDAWGHAKPEGKWTEVSADYRELEALVREKENHVDKERLHEKTATKEKREGRDRDTFGDKLEAFLKRKEEDDEATGLMEEVKKTW